MLMNQSESISAQGADTGAAGHSPFGERGGGCWDPCESYIESCCSKEHPYLAALYRATQTTLLRPRMASGHHQGQLLKLLVQITRAQRIVEIGTFSGYSALAMASGMEKGKVLTFEINDEQEDFTRPWIEQSPWADRVEFVIGDALELIPEREDVRDVDLCFIDANKRHYQQYLDLLLPRMRPGGLIVCDNTLWDGHLIDPTRHDPQTEALRRFNDALAQRTDLNVVLLPIRDGLTLITKN